MAMIIFPSYNVLDAMMISLITLIIMAMLPFLAVDAQLDYKAALASTLRERSAISIEEGFQRFVPRLCFDQNSHIQGTLVLSCLYHQFHIQN